MDEENVFYIYIYTIEFYSAIRNNDMWFESQWMLSEIIQTQKEKVGMFSLICGS
jgi:hypothetical protein